MLNIRFTLSGPIYTPGEALDAQVIDTITVSAAHRISLVWYGKAIREKHAIYKSGSCYVLSFNIPIDGISLSMISQWL